MSKAEEEQDYQDRLNAAGKNFNDFIEKSMGKAMTPEQKAAANKLFDKFTNITEANNAELSSAMKELVSATGLPKEDIISATDRLQPVHADDQDKKNLVQGSIKQFSIASNLRNDASSFLNKVNTYRENLDKLPYSETEKKVQHLNAALSAIEGLASKLIYSTQPPEKVAELTEALIQNRDACLEIMTDPKEKDKLILAIARTEAVIKGFGIPLDPKGAPYAELNTFGLNEETQAKVVTAIKQALKDSCGQKIDDVPPGTYSKKILDDVQKNLETQGISGADLGNCMKFAEQGKDKKRDYAQKYGINQEQVQDIATAATNSINAIIDYTKKDIEIINDSRNHAHSVLNAAIEELNKSGYKVSPEKHKKITDKLFSQLKGLGEEYLKENEKTISQEIAKELKQKKSFSAMFTSDYTISSEKLEKIGKKVVETHSAKANKTQEQKVTEMVEERKLEKSTLASRANHFYKTSGQNTKTSNPSTSELAQMRLQNPKLFDQVFNKPVAPPRPPKKVREASSQIGDDINHGHAEPRKRGAAVTEKSSPAEKTPRPPESPAPRPPQSPPPRPLQPPPPRPLQPPPPRPLQPPPPRLQQTTTQRPLQPPPPRLQQTTTQSPPPRPPMKVREASTKIGDDINHGHAPETRTRGAAVTAKKTPRPPQKPKGWVR